MTRCGLSGLLAAALLLPGAADAQWKRYHMERGNSSYDAREYEEAEEHYRASIGTERALPQADFNIGNSRYRRGQYDAAINAFGASAEGPLSVEERAWAHYNAGNAHLKAGRLEEAVRSYARSLRERPDDQDAKYNLSYALEKLRRQQQQQNQKQDKDQQQQQQQNQQQQPQDQQQDKQKEQQQQQQQQQQQPQQQQRRMAQADAERILEVLKNNEKEVQKKLRKRPASRVRVEKDW
jgi:Ca-activated chloride channel family protein